MELKATLKEYTAPEFQALVDKIWAVDLPKSEHDRLINHFDRIVGHPKGADLLFYPDSKFNQNSPESVVYYVRDWHHKQGMAAFKGEQLPVVTNPVAPLSPLARSLAEVQKMTADVAVSGQSVEGAFAVFEQQTQRLRSLQNDGSGIPGQETNIRALERAQHEALIAVNKFEFWKMRLEFAKSGAQRDLTYTRSEQAQWQNIVQQITATHAHYVTRLASITLRHRALHEAAEAELIVAHEHLIRSRKLAGVGPAQADRTLTASPVFAGKRPELLLTGGSSALLASQQVGLQKAIRSAVAEFSWRNTSGEPANGNEFAAVLRFAFSSRADTQVYALCVPLIELLPIEGQDWQHLAANRAQVDVPCRMSTASVPAKPGTMFKGLREISTLSQVHVTASRNRHSTAGVRVRAAQREEELNSFSFTAEGAAPISVHWPAPVSLETIPLTAPALVRPVEFVQSLAVPTLEPFTGEEDARFDDYIIVFPVESGFDPLYIMFRNPTEHPV
ncbi:bacteriocin immunity protein [Pseudomonas silesiensis]|uniref:bacteriocin immunity protein n=1 Tax=Pseudomonas silesiensis TaxID=1853130 RepID=UPI0030D8A201